MSSSLLALVAAALGTDPRVVAALLPVALLVGYCMLALPIYLWQRHRHGTYRDGEVENRGSSVLLAMPVRVFFAWAVRPLWRALVWTGIPASAVTTLSGLLSIAAGVAAAAGHLSLGGWLVLGAGLCDFFDGRLARASKCAGPRGAALDSIVDRYSDAAVLAGLAWFYRESVILVAAIMALVGSLLVSYVRARGEGLGAGADAKAGLMQRPERVVVLGLTMALSPLEALVHSLDGPSPTYWLTVAGLCVVAIGSQVTAFRRFVRLLRALGPASVGRAARVTPPLVAGAIASAAAATAVDFAVVVALVELLGARAWVATSIGCLVGAILNFSLNRQWVFRSLDDPVPQAKRYAITSVTSALLNAGGIAVLLLLPRADYRIAWAVVRAAVFLCWNFPLHNGYVYALRRGAEPSVRRCAPERAERPTMGACEPNPS